MKRAIIFGLTLVLIQSSGFVAFAQNDGTSSIHDKFEIAELVNSWGFYRDQGRWDELKETFHDDGTISISWFDGPHEKFVAISRQMAKKDANILKHHIGVPMIKTDGNRAISEVNVTIMVRAKIPKGEIDNTSYTRFYDLLEKRGGQWKIVKRFGIYEKDRLDPVMQPFLDDLFFKGLDEFPPELKFLAGALRTVNKTIVPSVIIDKSQAMGQLYKNGNSWLLGN